MLVRAIQCGLTIEKFWQITWRDFSIYTTAYDRQELNEWARTRKVSHMIFSTMAQKGKWQPENIWWPLPIDSQRPPKKALSSEQIKEALKKYR